jgi:hypothetical protein
VLRATDETAPIICLQAAGSITREDIARVIPMYDRLFGSRVPFIAINDARLSQFDANQRRLWAELSAHCARIDRGGTSLANILILDSPLLRGALTALNWIAQHKIPQYPVANVVEAIEVARRCVEEHRLVCSHETWGHVRFWMEQGYGAARGEVG